VSLTWGEPPTLPIHVIVNGFYAEVEREQKEKKSGIDVRALKKLQGQGLAM